LYTEPRTGQIIEIRIIDPTEVPFDDYVKKLEDDGYKIIKIDIGTDIKEKTLMKLEIEKQ
jgi:hypothetical protein